MRALLVQPVHTVKAWPLILKWVTEALRRGKGNQSSADIRSSLETGTMQLWLAWTGKVAKGCCITEVYESARGKTCGLVVVAGVDFSEWLPLTGHIKKWATEQGCKRLEAQGRPGWKRRVKSDGWKPIRTVIEMRF